QQDDRLTGHQIISAIEFLLIVTDFVYVSRSQCPDVRMCPYGIPRARNASNIGSYGCRAAATYVVAGVGTGAPLGSATIIGRGWPSIGVSSGGRVWRPRASFTH